MAILNLQILSTGPPPTRQEITFLKCAHHCLLLHVFNIPFARYNFIRNRPIT